MTPFMAEGREQKTADGKDGRPCHNILHTSLDVSHCTKRYGPPTKVQRTLLRAHGNGVLERGSPGGHVVDRSTDELVHLGRLFALTDKVDAAAAARVGLLSNDQLGQRYHAGLHQPTHTHTHTHTHTIITRHRASASMYSLYA